jgi:hypothetical protein
VATPVIEVGVHNTTYLRSVYNPLVSGQLAWDLGNGWGFSYLLGAYLEVNQEPAWSSTSLNQRFAPSYAGYGWNLTANVIYGIQFDHVTSRPQISPCPIPFGANGCNPDFLNVDLTATKSFGKWAIGPVAFGSTDLSTPTAGYQRQSQIAVGGLVGYDFGRSPCKATSPRTSMREITAVLTPACGAFDHPDLESPRSGSNAKAALSERLNSTPRLKAARTLQRPGVFLGVGDRRLNVRKHRAT